MIYSTTTANGGAYKSTCSQIGCETQCNCCQDEGLSRKSKPVFSGVINYFPDAILEVARCSQIGNDQHNKGERLHWDRTKSGDELDALARHLIQAGSIDDDGVRHSTKVAWRALANLQKELELQGEAVNSRYNLK